MAQDRTRLLEKLMEPVEVTDADRELAEKLMTQKSPAELAAMLVHAHRSKMPAPEDLMPNTPEARRAAQKDNHRPGFEDTVWFRMDIGRKQNADPRWILPLLCRRGHVTRNEIGAIRIGPDETYFQIPRNLADKFHAATQRTAGTESDEENINFEVSQDGPRVAARANRKGRSDPGRRPRPPGVKARPSRGPQGERKSDHKGERKNERKSDHKGDYKGERKGDFKHKPKGKPGGKPGGKGKPHGKSGSFKKTNGPKDRSKAN